MMAKKFFPLVATLFSIISFLLFLKYRTNKKIQYQKSFLSSFTNTTKFDKNIIGRNS